MAQPEELPRQRNVAIWTGSIVAAMAVGAVIAGCSIKIAPGAAPSTEKSAAPPATALSAEQCLEKQPVSFLAGQVLMIGLQAQDMPAEASLFKRYHVGGAVLMTAPGNPNDGSIQTFKKSAGSINDPVLISTDEEGGTVQRFEVLGKLPAPAQVAADFSPAQAQTLITQHGFRLKAAGVDMVLGPLADVAPPQGASPLGDRVLSSNPTVVSAYALAYVRGWQSAGLIPVIKHFPGMGSASGNTDYQIATTPPLSSLKQRDFVPYQALSQTGTAVMVGNQNVPGWFTGPASLSPVVNQYLRNTLGYHDTLVLTDSLSAAAITQTTSESQAVVEAIAAGNDMPLIVGTSTDTAANTALISRLESSTENAVKTGAISKQRLAQSVARKLAAQHIAACTIPSVSAP